MNSIFYSLLLGKEYLAHSFALQIFCVSSLLLVVGISAKVWFHAFKLAWVDTMTLDKVEAEHPYIPDFQVIRRVTISAFILMLTGVLLVTRFAPFEGPYEFLYLAGSFILVGVLAILSELHWQEYKNYSFAVLGASSIAFFLFAMRMFIESQNVAPSAFFAACLLVSSIVSWQLLRHVKKASVSITFLITIVFWFSIHFGSQLG